MKRYLPELNRRNLGWLRLACLVFSGLVLLALSGAPAAGAFLDGLSQRIGLADGILKAIFWFLLLVAVNEFLFRTLRSLWLRVQRVPEINAVIRTGDLQVVKRDIGALPRLSNRFKAVMESGDGSAVSTVNTLLSTGLSLEASDIHVSPGTEGAEVKLRIHGNLYSLGTIPEEAYPHFVRRIKVLSGLSIFKQSIPQDGQLNFDHGAYTVRVSVFPTISGERIAMRLAGNRAAVMEIDQLGLPQGMIQDYRALLNRSQGLLIINGPTGSGKTSTLFSSLLQIQKTQGERVNIVTLEDPMEIRLEGVQQTQVEQGTGLSFSAGLRSVLRQDPDVIMLGEIRDEETAEIAVRAAMTGHLILTTVHAGSTAGVFNRLAQMGIDPQQLSATVRAVLSQRLCRRLCGSCRIETEPSSDVLRQLHLLGVSETPRGPFYESPGCDECLGKGFSGRIALFEMLLVTDTMKDHISRGVPDHVLTHQARAEGMPSLLDHGLSLARDGQVSLSELVRIVTD